MKHHRIITAAIAGTAALALAVAIPVTAAASAHSNATPKARIIGTWPNDVSVDGTGGYLVWNTGKVQALGHAPYYGSVRLPVTDIVGFAADSLSGGYWLIGANGTVYSEGSTCQDETLSGPTVKPTSGVIGAINLAGEDEGFTMVTAVGAMFSFICKFTI